MAQESGVKRPPLDPWSVRERLWLAMAVSRCGAQNWVSVSRALRPLQHQLQRPPDWFGQRSCAAQYTALLERCQTTTGRRKKRNSEGGLSSLSSETPQDMILQMLTEERVTELHSLMAEESRKYRRLKDEVRELLSNNIAESRLRALAAGVEDERRNREREAAKNALRLQEREERRATLERSRRRPDSEAPHPSPLLTSLLQSSTPLGQSDAAGTSTSPSAVRKHRSDSNSVSINDLEKIEQIKSELQKIEQNFIEGSISADRDSLVSPSLRDPESAAAKSSPSTDHSKTEKIDIDDIELKAIDVYTFSDIDLVIPPVSSMHKTVGRVCEKNPYNKRDLPQNSTDSEDAGQPLGRDESQDLDPSIDVDHDCTDENLAPIAGDISSALTESDGNKINITNVDTREVAQKSNGEMQAEKSKNSDAQKPSNDDTNTIKTEETGDLNVQEKLSDIKKDLIIKKTDNVERVNLLDSSEKEIHVGAGNITEITFKQENTYDETEKSSQNTHKAVQSSESNIETDDDIPIEVVKEDKPGKTKRDYSRKKVDKDERTSPIGDQDGTISSKVELSDEVGSDNSQESADKKTLHRRFRNELGGSRSESPSTPTDSLPNSPAPSTPPISASSTTEQDKDYRIWKKSVCLVLNRLNTLKYAPLFRRPILDEHAPSYSKIVKRPVDLSSIRKNIDNGTIRTTQEFQRDVLLMLTNAIMYNRSDDRVHIMANETLQEAIVELNVLLQVQSPNETQILSRLTRPPRPASRSAGPPAKRKRGSGVDTPLNKKRRTDDNQF